MTDDDMRLLIRAAIARHCGATAPPFPPEAPRPEPVAQVPLSFARYGIPRSPDDVMCLIEPAVKCTHCGYCLCHGH